MASDGSTPPGLDRRNTNTLDNRLQVGPRLDFKNTNERKRAKHAEVVQTSQSTEIVDDSVHNRGEDDESDNNNMNIPKDSLMPEYGVGINALRYFTLTEPETDSGHSLVNHVQVPEHQQPIPRKRTRLSAGLDSGCSTPPEGSFDPQDASVDEEMSRLENSYRNSTKHNIQALD